ncbi:MAG: thio(seleno)oxazole modification radical SAM maturase SbtM [Nitrospirota bacterium]
MTGPEFHNIFPACRAVLGHDAWTAVLAACSDVGVDAVPGCLARTAGPPFLSDLARLELTIGLLSDAALPGPGGSENLAVNPTVRLLELSWKGLCSLLPPAKSHDEGTPEQGIERVLSWRDPNTGGVVARPAENDDLLALKMAVEGLSAEAVAAEGKLPVSAVDAVIDRAVRQGLLLAPPSKLRRDPAVFAAKRKSDEEFLVSDSFTLQWHITQICDLHCKHCYDRTDRSPLTFEQAVKVLDDLHAFCKERRVQGAISFTGGNPLLHPRFLDIYRAAVDRGFGTAILGNPAPRDRIEEIISIQKPVFFQVSLEGLREHNDSIRGTGHFDRILAFLDILRDLGVYSMVMLTLTRDNMDQVIPLAKALRDKVDVFHFNRLALFGEGANLSLPDRKRYRTFLEDYLQAAETNPVMGIKENLINVLRREKGIDLYGGCAGYGCGAAFNFVSLLADGEVHACRKLPSPIGNLYHASLADIYDSEKTRRYRLGPSACRGCDIRPACGGCLASTLSHGLNIFENKDPFCFIE